MFVEVVFPITAAMRRLKTSLAMSKRAIVWRKRERSSPALYVCFDIVSMCEGNGSWFVLFVLSYGRLSLQGPNDGSEGGGEGPAYMRRLLLQ